MAVAATQAMIGPFSEDLVEFASSAGVSIDPGVQKGGIGSSVLIDHAVGTSQNTAEVRGYAEGVRNTFDMATGHVSFDVRVATLPSSTDMEILTIRDGVDAQKCAIEITPTGEVRYARADGIQLGLTGEIITAGPWHRYDVKCGKGASAAWELKVDGNSELSGTSSGLGSGNTSIVRIGKFNTNSESAHEYNIQNIFVEKNDYAPNALITGLKPSADGTYTAWTGGWADVDDIPFDNFNPDAVPPIGTGLVATTNGWVETVGLTSAAGAGIGADDTIHFVMPATISKKTSIFTRENKLRLRTASDADSGAFVLDSNYRMHAKMYAVDPDDSAAWTRSRLDSAQIGVVAFSGHTATRKALCTQLILHVAFEVAVASVTRQPRSGVTMSGPMMAA